MQYRRFFRAFVYHFHQNMRISYLLLSYGKHLFSIVHKITDCGHASKQASMEVRNMMKNETFFSVKYLWVWILTHSFNQQVLTSPRRMCAFSIKSHYLSSINGRKEDQQLLQARRAVPRAKWCKNLINRVWWNTLRRLLHWQKKKMTNRLLQLYCQNTTLLLL